MHPMKAKVLAQLAETSRIQDDSLRRGLRVVAAPGKYGWAASLLTAVVMLPLTGLSAVLTDVSRVMIARSADETWERVPPPRSSEE